MMRTKMELIELPDGYESTSEELEQALNESVIIKMCLISLCVMWWGTGNEGAVRHLEQMPMFFIIPKPS